MFQSTHRSLAIKSTLFVLSCYGALGCANLEAPEEGSLATAEQGRALTESQAWIMPTNGPLVLDTCWEGAKSADGSSLGLVAPEPPPATATQDTTSVDGQERLALVRDTVKGGWARYARVVYGAASRPDLGKRRRLGVRRGGAPRLGRAVSRTGRRHHHHRQRHSALGM